MKKETSIRWRNFNSIPELHDALALPEPSHPLISLINCTDVNVDVTGLQKAMSFNFYKVSFKKFLSGRIKCDHDFKEGSLSFFAPNQLITTSEEEACYDNIALLFHPDFIRGHWLGIGIKTYGFFSYSPAESLHLSAKEKDIIACIFESIQYELSKPIDSFSQPIIISQIEQILNYSNRFYHRQFTARKTIYNDLLIKLQRLLDDYFDNDEALTKGLPSVQYLSEQLQVSPRYLSDMLRQYTGHNTQQHIHNTLIEKAKEIIIGSNLTVGQVAYKLGFEHPQSFIRMFKSKTKTSPLEFRQSIHHCRVN